jgi:hypothetical protein
MKNDLKTRVYVVIMLISVSTSFYFYTENTRLKNQLNSNGVELLKMKNAAELQMQQAAMNAAMMDKKLKSAEEQLGKK